MNFKTALIAVLTAGIPLGASAFNLDAVGYDGSRLSPTPLILLIPGYGEVLLDTSNDREIMLVSAYQNGDGIGGSSVKFHPSEATQIHFRDEKPLEMNFDSQPIPETWTAIPEATSAFLGLIGMGLLLLRRR
jgi:hypothetical protein